MAHSLFFPDQSEHELFNFLHLPANLEESQTSFSSPSSDLSSPEDLLPVPQDFAPWSQIQPMSDLPFFDDSVIDIPPAQFSPSSPSEQLPSSPCSSSSEEPRLLPIKQEATEKPAAVPPASVVASASSSSTNYQRKRARTTSQSSARQSSGAIGMTSPSSSSSSSPYSPPSSPSSPESKSKVRADGLSYDYSSDDGEFDLNAMPHPSIFTKTPSELSKEELLSLTSRGLEEYERRLKTFHTLTHSEQSQLKRQRRLIKNRESAQQSRMRKKVYVQDLERRVTNLLAERDDLRRINQDLSAKNENLQAQVNLLHEAMRSFGGSPSDFPLPQRAKREPTHSPTIRASQTAGVCVLVLVLSFTLLFSFGSSPSPGSAPPLSVGGSGGSSNLPRTDWGTGRHLNELVNLSTPFMTSKSSPIVQTPSSPLVDITSLTDSEDDTEDLLLSSASASASASASSYYSQRSSSSKSTAVISSSSSPSSPPPPEDYYKGEGDGALVLKTSSEDAEQVLLDDLPLAPPSYIYCAEAQQLIPLNEKGVSRASADYPLISLLLPASAIDISLLSLTKSQPVESSTLMKLSCQVLGIETFPLAGHGTDFALSYTQR